MMTSCKKAACLMVTIVKPILSVPFVLVLSASLFGQDPALDDLPTLRNFESHRITSADPTGGNADWWDIGPGQTRVLAEIQGPGRIVHFRDNITSREPHHLQLHVLRIYWDGEKEPSVEAPVGDFFGVGFGFTRAVQLRADVHRPAAGETDRPGGDGGRAQLLHPHALRPRGPHHAHQRGQAVQPPLGRDQLSRPTRARRRTSSISTPNTAKARRRRKAPT